MPVVLVACTLGAKEKMPAPTKLQSICEECLDLTNVGTTSIQGLCDEIQKVGQKIRAITSCQLPTLNRAVEQFHEKHLRRHIPVTTKDTVHSQKHSVGVLLGGIDGLYLQCTELRADLPAAGSRLPKEKSSFVQTYAVGYTPEYVQSRSLFDSAEAGAKVRGLLHEPLSPVKNLSTRPGDELNKSVQPLEKSEADTKTAAPASTGSDTGSAPFGGFKATNAVASPGAGTLAKDAGGVAPFGVPSKADADKKESTKDSDAAVGNPFGRAIRPAVATADAKKPSEFGFGRSQPVATDKPPCFGALGASGPRCSPSKSDKKVPGAADKRDSNLPSPPLSKPLAANLFGAGAAPAVKGSKPADASPSLAKPAGLVDSSTGVFVVPKSVNEDKNRNPTRSPSPAPPLFGAASSAPKVLGSTAGLFLAVAAGASTKPNANSSVAVVNSSAAASNSTSAGFPLAVGKSDAEGAAAAAKPEAPANEAASASTGTGAAFGSTLFPKPVDSPAKQSPSAPGGFALPSAGGFPVAPASGFGKVPVSAAAAFGRAAPGTPAASLFGDAQADNALAKSPDTVANFSATEAVKPVTASDVSLADAGAAAAPPASPSGLFAKLPASAGAALGKMASLTPATGAFAPSSIGAGVFGVFASPASGATAAAGASKPIAPFAPPAPGVVAATQGEMLAAAAASDSDKPESAKAATGVFASPPAAAGGGLLAKSGANTTAAATGTASPAIAIGNSPALALSGAAFPLAQQLPATDAAKANEATALIQTAPQHPASSTAFANAPSPSPFGAVPPAQLDGAKSAQPPPVQQGVFAKSPAHSAFGQQAPAKQQSVFGQQPVQQSVFANAPTQGGFGKGPAQSAFGQQAPAPQQSAFSQPATQPSVFVSGSANAPVQSAFGKGPAQSVFGQQAPQLPAQQGAFGKTSSQNAFGQAPVSLGGFGSAPAQSGFAKGPAQSAFGQLTPAQQQTCAFGQQAAPQLPAQRESAFGKAPGQSAFGKGPAQSVFGQQAPQLPAQQGAFGKTSSQNAFGQAPVSLGGFGSVPAQNGFAKGPAQSGFGQQAPAQQQQQAGFGKPGAFGQSAAPQSGFGNAPAPSAFGKAPGQSAFGQQSHHQQSAFGQNSGGVPGVQQGFGAVPQNAFSAGGGNSAFQRSSISSLAGNYGAPSQNTGVFGSR